MKGILIFIGIIILLMAVNHKPLPPKRKRKSKKFGEGMFEDTNTTNWKPPL